MSIQAQAAAALDVACAVELTSDGCAGAPRLRTPRLLKAAPSTPTSFICSREPCACTVLGELSSNLVPVRANQQRSSENVAKKKARAAHELPFFISEVLISEAHAVPTDSSLCGAVRRQQINKRRPRRAKRRAQLKLVSLRFGDAVRHEEYGTGLVFDMESKARAGTGAASVSVYWLDPMVGPPFRGPRVSARELSHDWHLQEKYPDICGYGSITAMANGRRERLT